MLDIVNGAGDVITYDWIDTSNDYIQAFEEELKKRGVIEYE